MFANPRSALLLVALTMILAGALLATVVINATTGRTETNPTSPAAIAVATRSLPADWVIRPGDTFDSIAAQNHLSPSQLQQLNPTQDPTTLLAGQHLRLHLRSPTPRLRRPLPPRFWIVLRGQTYTSIAAKTGLRAADIAQLNPTVNPNALVPGQRLKLRP